MTLSIPGARCGFSILPQIDSSLLMMDWNESSSFSTDGGRPVARGLAPRRLSGHASGGQVRLLVNTTGPIATMSILRIVSQISGPLNASSRQSRRVSSGLSQHCFQLRLGEFHRLPHSWLARHLLCHRAGTGGQQRRSSLRHRPYLGFCCWRLVTTLHTQTS